MKYLYDIYVYIYIQYVFLRLLTFVLFCCLKVDKVVQLYETMMTRHTTMIVGPTGGGKSVVINTLAQAQIKLSCPTKLYTINPKDRSVTELYGISLKTKIVETIVYCSSILFYMF